MTETLGLGDGWPIMPTPRTLRDDFAAAAMNGFLFDRPMPLLMDEFNGDIERCYTEIATHAYKLADAMLRARLQPKAEGAETDGR